MSDAAMRWSLPGGSALLIALVNAVAVAAGPVGDAHLALLACGLAAAAVGLQSAFWDSDTLGLALLLSVPPIVPLVASEVGQWLIGPMGALLLVAAELNLLGWEARRRGPSWRGMGSRATQIGMLGGAGMGASLAVAAVGLGSPVGGLAALLVAAAALAILARVLFGRGG